MAPFKEDFAWSTQFIPAIKQIVGPRLLVPASLELDTKEATDLIIFMARDMRIAARMRSVGYEEKYPYDFTIRSRRDSGSETELSKIMSGWGDWFFYGHDGGNSKISHWRIFDLNVFRRSHHMHEIGLETIKWVVHPNKDVNGNRDGTWFRAYDALSFPRGLVIASSRWIEDIAA